MPPAGRGLSGGHRILVSLRSVWARFPSPRCALAPTRARAPPLSARVSSAARVLPNLPDLGREPHASVVVQISSARSRATGPGPSKCATAGSSGRKSDITPFKPPIHRASCGHLEGPAAARRSATPTLASGVLAHGAAHWWRLLISTRRPLPPCASRAPPSRRHFRHTHLAACRFASTARHTGGWLLPSSDT